MDAKQITPASDRPEYAATDRELLLGLLNLVSALAERITGECVEVLMLDAGGELLWADPEGLLRARRSHRSRKVAPKGPCQSELGTAGAALELLQALAFKLTGEEPRVPVLYTDGVVEASAANGTLYGSDRLERVLAQADTHPHDIAERILASVTAHLAEVPANDDLTLFICQRNVGRPASMQPRRRSGMNAFTLPLPPRLPEVEAPRSSRPAPGDPTKARP